MIGLTVGFLGGILCAMIFLAIPSRRLKRQKRRLMACVEQSTHEGCGASEGDWLSDPDWWKNAA